MKSKKMAKLIHEEFRNCEKESRPMQLVEEISNGDWSEYDPEVSEKFKKMILNLTNYKNNININIDSSRVSISTSDVTTVKKPIKRNSNTLYSDDNYVEMSLHKNLGFSINYGYNSEVTTKMKNYLMNFNQLLYKDLKK